VAPLWSIGASYLGTLATMNYLMSGDDLEGEQG
jgi:hypothetical protein